MSELANNEAARAFSRLRWNWLDQVGRDTDLPAVCGCLAIVLATTYFKQHPGYAYCGLQTLALDIGKGVSTVRAALEAMEARKHVAIIWTAGGRGKTNHIHMTLWKAKPSEKLESIRDSKPSGKSKGLVDENPPTSTVETLQDSPGKPSEKLEGTPESTRDTGSGGGPSGRPPSQGSAASTVAESYKVHTPDGVASSETARAPEDARPYVAPQKPRNAYAAARDGE